MKRDGSSQKKSLRLWDPGGRMLQMLKICMDCEGNWIHPWQEDTQMPVTKEKTAQEVPEWKTMVFWGVLKKSLTASSALVLHSSQGISFWLLPGGKIPARHKINLERRVFTVVELQFGF